MIAGFIYFFQLFIPSPLYLFRTKDEQILLVLAGSQDACWGADIENLVCGQVELDMWGIRAFPWKQRIQVGLHDLPVKRKLQVALFRDEEKRKKQT